MNTQKSPIQIEVFEAPIGGVTKRCVNARTLHSALENATPLNKWMARKIEDFCFKESEDFQTFLSESSGGRPATEYTISIDMAKELCMLERSEIGRATRKYFIECERQLQEIVKISNAEESSLGNQLLAFLGKLERTSNEFSKQICVERVKRLCMKLKTPLPPIELLEKKEEKDQ
ncbi:antA/AntB antirepressor family protein [Vibrio vulnificus]|uniref:antA/AntB antirepressor family protein n=1 Tax=Vibrio vulnificus TaxID=672 RepID=UPI000B4D3187|nr:antA/AntB antirepressor family protein [Vibrio vulnificus]